MRILFPLVFITLFVAGLVAQSPAAIERDLLTQLKNAEKYGSYGESSDDAKLDAANKQIRELLIRNGGRAEILKYGFPKLKNEMYIATSPDGKLRIYSWDLQTGGSMHDYDNVFQFEGTSGKVYTWTPRDGDESDGGFFNQLSQVDTANGPIYLANSASSASGTDHSQSIEVMRINGDSFERNPKLIQTRSGLASSIGFEYDLNSVRGESEKLVYFDPVKKSFRFPVVIDDKKTGLGRVTGKYITYQFNGKYFVKVA